MSRCPHPLLDLERLPTKDEGHSGINVPGLAGQGNEAIINTNTTATAVYIPGPCHEKLNKERHEPYHNIPVPSMPQIGLARRAASLHTYPSPTVSDAFLVFPSDTFSVFPIPLLMARLLCNHTYTRRSLWRGRQKTTGG